MRGQTAVSHLLPPQILARIERISLVELLQKVAIGLFQTFRDDDLRLGKQVAWGGVPGGHAMSFDAKLGAVEVPGGIVRVTVPTGVGTSTLAPAAASPTVKGMRTCRWFPFLVKKGCGATWMVMRMSPGVPLRSGRFALAADDDSLFCRPQCRPVSSP